MCDGTLGSVAGIIGIGGEARWTGGTLSSDIVVDGGGEICGYRAGGTGNISGRKDVYAGRASCAGL